MILTYILNVDILNDDIIFNERLGTITKERRDKVLKSKFQADRNRSLGASILLEYAVRDYIEREPKLELKMESTTPLLLEYGTNGKPYLMQYPDIHFSLSHAGNYALCTVGDCEVGGDIEGNKDLRMNVAKRFFTDKEYEWIKEITDYTEQAKRFFRIWTLKESFLKITGMGMALPLNEFEFSFERGEVTNDKELYCEYVQINQHFNTKHYFFKEYMVDNYCVAVASEKDEFKDELLELYLK